MSLPIHDPSARKRQRALRQGERRPSDFVMAQRGLAWDHEGFVSVSEGVLVAGAPFKNVDPVLRGMATMSCIGVTNDPESSAVPYVLHAVFHQLAGGISFQRPD